MIIVKVVVFILAFCGTIEWNHRLTLVWCSGGPSRKNIVVFFFSGVGV